VGIAFGSCGIAAGAEVLNFDDLSAAPGGVVPASYGGFDFGDGQFFLQSDAEYTAAAPDGYGNTYSAPSPSYAAGNDPARASFTVSRGEPFDFLGAAFSTFGAFDEFQDYSATSVRVEGFDGATPVGELTAALAADGYAFVPAGFEGVTSVVLTPDGPGADRYFLLDDFTYAEVPEPATAAAVALLAGLLSGRRSRLRRCERGREG
jgi:hypothetical protein